MDWVGLGRARVDPFTKRTRLGHGRSVNYLGRVGHFVQINGSGRPMGDQILVSFKMAQIYAKNRV